MARGSQGQPAPCRSGKPGSGCHQICVSTYSFIYSFHSSSHISFNESRLSGAHAIVDHNECHFAYVQGATRPKAGDRCTNEQTHRFTACCSQCYVSSMYQLL